MARAAFLHPTSLQEYHCRLATWRTTDPGQMAAALQVEKPDAVSPDQLDLFEGLIA